MLVVDGDAVLGCDWAIRVVPNKFPALTPEGTPTEGHVGPHRPWTGVARTTWWWSPRTMTAWPLTP